MRIIHFADVHIDATFPAFGPDAGSARRAAVRRTFERIIDLALERRVDAVFCAGDLFEQERIAPDTGAFLRERLRKLHPIPVYIAPGNQDWLCATSPYRRGGFPDNVHVFEREELTAVELEDGLTLWGAAFTTPTREAGFLDDFRAGRDGTHIALFHGSEVGAFRHETAGKQRQAPFDASRMRESGLLHAFIGHHHAPTDGERFTYPGNPEPLTFGEQGERGVVIATIESGRVARERVAVTETRIQDIRFDVSEYTESGALRSALAKRLRSESGYVRVLLCGDLDPEIDLQRADLATVRAGLTAPPLIVGDGLFPTYDLGALRTEPTVRGGFLRQVQSDPDLSDDERRRIILTGLRAFESRDDLEVA